MKTKCALSILLLGVSVSFGQVAPDVRSPAGPINPPVFTGTTTGAVPYMTASGLMAFLPLVANQKIFGGTNGLPQYATGYKVGTLTRDMTRNSESVSYTGVGFKPALVIFIASIQSTFSYSIGADDGSTHLSQFYNTGNSIIYYASASIHGSTP